MEIVDRDDENLVDPPRELSELDKKEVREKPLQTWTSADGSTSIRAWQVEVQRENSVILLTETGEVRRVPLSSLKSEDAYRAVQQHVAEKQKARDELQTQLEAGLAMLENKQFKEFAIAIMPGAEFDPDSMAALVERERGLFIYQFETALRELNAPNNPSVRFAELPSGETYVEIRSMMRAVSPRLRLIYTGGRWKYRVR
jgi:hypothetical protein